MSNGNVERCATLLITRSESEYHGDVLFLSFSFFFLFFLTRIRFRARERSGRFFGRLGDGLSGREFRERRGNIWWQWSRRSAPGCAADTYICRDFIALPRFVYSHLSGTLSAGCCTTEVFDVSTSIAHCAGFMAVVTQRIPAARRFSMKSSDRSKRYSSRPFLIGFRKLLPFRSPIFFSFFIDSN